MADPRTKEELLQEIKNTESENQNYREFKESLTNLNHDIEELMKPVKEGWKLMDEETFAPFYGKYKNTAKKLSAYLSETAESTDPKEKNLRDICIAFRKHFAADMEIMREYSTELTKEQKSLPTLFESSRVQTITLNNKNVDVRGGAMSSRIAMKVTKKNGEERDGFFTRSVRFEPLKGVQDALDRTAERTNKPVAIAMLKNFTRIYREYCRQKNISEAEGIENLNKIMNAVGTNFNGRPVVSPTKFCGIYSQMIEKIGIAKAAEITGLPKKDVPTDMDLMFNSSVEKTMSVELGKAWNSMLNLGVAGITPNSRLDTRNVAMSNVAHLLGMENLVCGARMLKLESGNGTVTEGIFMEKARGVDPNNPGEHMDLVTGDFLKYGDCRCLKQLADLQVLDYICGNIDRHGGNIFFEFDPETYALIGIQGIDNDLSFGTLKPKTECVGHLMTPPYMGAISKETAETILALSPDVFAYTLHGILDQEEVDAAKFRLENMQNAILASREKLEEYKQQHPGELDRNGISIGQGAMREIGENDWKNVNMKQLFKPKKGVKNIFVEAKETLDDFQSMAKYKVNEVDYVSTETLNRAEEAGISSRLKRTEELKEELSKWATPDAPESFGKLEEAMQKHAELLSKIFTRTENCKKKVKADTAETGEYFGQYVTKDDLEKVRESEKRIRDAVLTYSGDRQVVPGKKGPDVGNARNRREIEAVADVHEFIKNSNDRTPEEDKTLKANHRKAVEEVARAIAKNPDSPAAGPKNPVNPAKKAKPAAPKAGRAL